MNFKIFDGRGSFYQWDLNQKLIVDGITLNDKIHFKNIDGVNALVVEPYSSGENILVDVPNVLLQKANSITVWVYVNNDHTKEQAVFNVIPRQKPADYIYTPTEVSVWKVLEEAVENIPNEYAKKNHVHSQYLTKETDPSVEDWAKKGSEYEITGNPVTLENIEHMPMNVVTTLEPIRAGSGNPSATNVRPISGWTGAKLTRCGKNLLKINAASVTKNGVTFTVNANGSVTVSGTTTAGNTFFNLNYIDANTSQLKPGATYILSGGSASVRLRAYVDGSYAVDDSGNGATLTISANAKSSWLRLNIADEGVTVNETIWPMARLSTETDGSFAPYAGNTYAADFGQTVYGGELDWNTGVLTVECLMSTLDGSDDEGWTIYTGEVTGNQNFYTSGYSALPGIVATGNKQIPGWCSWADTQDGIIAGMRRTADDSDRIFIPVETLTGWGVAAGDMNGFKAMLAENPMQIVYKVATPTTIQLTPHEIEALRGVNTLYGDGSLNVSGSKDVYWLSKNLVERIKTLESAIISLGGNV